MFANEKCSCSDGRNVWKVLVEVGDKVVEGQELVILESMKMEVPIESESIGTVIEIKAVIGEFVNEGDVVIVIQ
ncbi:acetyl-CoA carboxylase biotin carboxyl carrier protein subunit [Anaerobacillus sp. HL2]|nr:acetyl-CoA carboxylase biotin carboxyl carrier protein subunit [Anaerobacillus sp. HL2]